MTPTDQPIHLAIALNGAGWHPGAWRTRDARPTDLLNADYWTDLVVTAEAALADFVTIEDSLGLQADDPFRPDNRTDRVRGLLDAVSIASRTAPATRHIGLIPTVITTHTEPFHISKAIATLDYVSEGRAGARVQIAPRRDVSDHFGRRDLPEIDRSRLDDPATVAAVRDHVDEAIDHVEVSRRLWDSWGDDAEIRDVVTGRFVDRDEIHYIDFEGRWFSVKGPSITPRPPQGQPIVAALGHGTEPYRLIATSADIGFVTPTDAESAAEIVGAIRDLQHAVARTTEPVHIFADLLVVLDDTEDAAHRRLAELDRLAGAPLRGDASVFAGTAAQLADLIEQWHGAGITGYRLRPAVLPVDLTQISRLLVPELQSRKIFRTRYPDEPTTLRSLLGLPRPVNRYART